MLPPVILSVRRTGAAGGDLVRGNAPGVTAGDTIRAVVMDLLGNQLQDAPGYLDTTGGKFYIALDKPLGAKQFVRVFVTRRGFDIAASNAFGVPDEEAPEPPARQTGTEVRAAAGASTTVKADNASRVVIEAETRSAPPAPPAARPAAEPNTDERPAPVACDFSVDPPRYQAPELQLQAGADNITVPSPFQSGTAQVCVGQSLVVPANREFNAKVFAFERSPIQLQLPDKLLENQTVSVVVWKKKPASKDDVYVFRATTPGDPCVAQVEPSLKIGNLRQDERKLAGEAPEGAGKLRVCINGKPAELTDGKVTSYKDRKFTAELNSPLSSAKAAVRLVFLPDAPKSRAVAADVAVLTSCYQPNSLLFGPMPKEGDTTIKGLGVKSAGDAKCAVSVIVDGDLVDLKDPQNKPVSSVDISDKGEFTANLMTSLQSGQCVTLVQFDSGSHPDYPSFRSASCNAPFRPEEAKGTAATTARQVVKSEYVISALNLGRWRAYFAAGVVLAHDQGNFNSQHLFLAFDVDRNWLWGGLNAHPKAPGRSDYKRLMLNTYFETRLTSIPVVGTDGKNLDSFVTSQKAGVLQGGVYLPILLTTWRSHQTHNALSLGPIAKVGLETPVDNLDASGVVQPGGRKSFYTFFGYGVRMGTHRMSASRSLAPELLSYFDAVLGRFSSMDSDPLLLNPLFAGNSRFGPGWQYPGTYAHGGGQYLRYARPWRIGMEGILKIPGYPFVLGVGANVHQHFGIGSSHTVGPAERDDLRFFIGTRFDFGNLAQKLKSLSNTTGGSQ